MAGQHSNQDPAKATFADGHSGDQTSKSKTSWFKSKATKVFSSSKSLKSASTGTGTILADSNGGPSSQDKASSKLPYHGGQSQLSTPNPNVESSAEQLIQRPISELWNEAYEELYKKDKGLVTDYEVHLSESLVGAVAAGQASATVFSGLGKVQRRQQMKALLDQKIKEIEEGTWKLRFRDHELVVKDLVEPVVGVIDWAKDFVGTALEPSPYGSIAWAGVCVLLPLVLNPSKQEAARVKALDDVATIISKCTMREALYHRRYEMATNDEPKTDFSALHIGYRDVLRALYVEILRFQATSVCFLSKNGFGKVIADTVKWNDWDKMLADIEEQENTIKSTEEQWRDMKYDEECNLNATRHEQRMRGLSAIEEEVSRVRNVIMQAQKDNEREELLKWLSSVDPSTNYNSARRNHAESTSDWLVEKSSDFKKWKSDPNSFLWLHGQAGAGKSFLSSSVIHHLEELYHSDPYTAVAYFYFSFSDQQKQSTENMIRSLIVQICGRRPDTPKQLLDLRRFRDVNHQPDLESLETTLQASIQDFKNVYLVVDALDECPLSNDERDKLLKGLGRIHGSSLTNLHVMCTSRPELDIKAKLEPLFLRPVATVVDLQKQRKEVDRDIRTYIDQKIESLDFRSWPPELKEQVKAALTEKANGMFQYVALQLKALERAKSSNAVEQALADLPAGLDGTYNRALLSIHPSQIAQAICALKWLAFSFRPIRLDELAEALIIDPNVFPPIDKERRLFNPQDVLDFLPGLVIVSYDYEDLDDDSLWANSDELETKSITDVTEVEEWSSNDIREVEGFDSKSTSEVGQRRFIRLAHFSIKEFLTSDRIKKGPASSFSVNEDDAHIYIASSCLIYHLYISEVECLTHTPESLYKSLSLWEYATDQWPSYAEVVSQDAWPQSLQSLIMRALKLQTQPLLTMLQSWKFTEPSLDKREIWSLNFDQLPSSLYFLVVKDCFQLSSFVLKHKIAEVNVVGGFYDTALHAACSRGYESIVQLLLDAEANPFLGNVDNCCALEVAILGHSEGCAKILLERENALGQCEKIRYRPIVDAAQNGLLTIVERLLQLGADVNAEQRGWTALQGAAWSGHLNIAKLLIENGGNVNRRGTNFGNAVQVAAAVGHTDTMKLLLEYGAEVDAPGPEWEDLLKNIDRVYYHSSSVGSTRLRDLQSMYGEASRRGDLTKYKQ